MRGKRKNTSNTKLGIHRLLDANSMKQGQSYLNSLGTITKEAAAKTILNVLNDDEQGGSGGKKRSKIDLLPYKTGTTQDAIPVEFVKNGVIRTSDGRYISIIEVLSANFYKKSEQAKIKMAANFGSIFGDAPDKLQIKILNDIVDTNVLIRNLQKYSTEITDPKARQGIVEYIKFIRNSSSVTSMQTRYLIIYEFEGEERRFEDIALRMQERRESICGKLHAAGNLTIDKQGRELDEHLKDILYYFYNRRTSLYESRRERSIRVEKDIKAYNAAVSEEDKYVHRIQDDLAPKGLDFTHRKCLKMDGYYYTYLGVKTNSYPQSVTLGWIDCFSMGSAIDVDLYFNIIPKQAADIGIKAIERVEGLKRQKYQSKGNYEKEAAARENLQNAINISTGLRGNLTLYNMAIILTLKALTERNLGQISRRVQSDLYSNYKIKFDTADSCVEDYFLMTNPLLFFRAPWRRLHHNILSNEIATTYCFNNYQFYDPNGVVFGSNLTTQALMVIDIFNSGVFNNPNMLITGMPGSGKTFALHMLIERYYFNGANVYSIIPKKGEQYKQVCDVCGGKYYNLTKDCINLMAILPEKKLDTTKISETVNWDKTSLLAKKIRSITTFLCLLSGAETIPIRTMNLLENKLSELYKNFGIDNNNASIWQDKANRILKPMPIIQDMYEMFYASGELRHLCEYLRPFVGDGKLRHLNGQTNIDTNCRFIAFNCDEDQIGRELLPAVLHIPVDYCYSKVKDPTSYKSIINIDECWSLMKNAQSAAQLDDMVRIIRGYSGGCILATQQIDDFRKCQEIGESIIHNCALKLILKNDNLHAVKHLLKITSNDCDRISSYRKINQNGKRGNMGMLVTLDDKIEILLEPSEYEYQNLKDKTSV